MYRSRDLELRAQEELGLLRRLDPQHQPGQCDCPECERRWREALRRAALRLPPGQEQP